MNSVSLLVREHLSVMDPDEQLKMSTLSAAETKLGYKHPEKERIAARSKLAEAMRVAGIKPFTKLSVSTYKGAEVRKHREKAFWRMVSTLPDGLEELFGVVTILGLVISVGLMLALPQGEKLRWGGSILGLSCLSAAVFVILIVAENRPWIEVGWRTSPLEGYDGPIPEFALATALELHERVPSCKFFIDELVVNERQHDPFLVVRFDGQEYYVEVWAEPGYKQQRIA